MKKLISSVLRDCGFSLNWREDRSKVYFGISFTVLFCVACSSAPLWLIGIVALNAAVSSYPFINK